VNPAHGLQYSAAPVIAIYALLTVATIYVLRRMVRNRPLPEAPQEADVQAFEVV